MLITLYMDSFDMGENGGVMILQGVIILLAVVIVFMIFSEKSKTSELQVKLDNFKCPTCPAAPECPACNCAREGTQCPDCVCSNDMPNLECPACPGCPEANVPTVDDIVNAIFPGRNPGMTTHGRFFSYDDFTDKELKSTFQSMDDMTANTMGSGIPSLVNFEDQTLTNSRSDIGLASKVAPPMGSGSGLFSQPSSVAEPGGQAVIPAPAAASAPAPAAASAPAAAPAPASAPAPDATASAAAAAA
jgi:hypothetical protein